MLRDAQAGNANVLACGLVEEVVRTYGEVRLRVFGTSMAPSLLPGDLVSIQRARASEISTGEIVLFARAGRFFVHRVVERDAQMASQSGDETRLVTRGDRLLQNDPAVSSSELLGRVVAIERRGERLTPDAAAPNSQLARLLRSSDLFTRVYLRVASLWRSALPLRRVKCQA